MSQIMKCFLGIFLLLLLAVTSAGIMGGFLQVLEAQNTHSRIITELEDSNYNAGVIEECFDKARACDYTVELHLYDKDGNGYELKSDRDRQIRNKLNGVQINGGEVKLTFVYAMGFFDISQTHVLSGYAI